MKKRILIILFLYIYFPLKAQDSIYLIDVLLNFCSEATKEEPEEEKILYIFQSIPSEKINFLPIEKKNNLAGFAKEKIVYANRDTNEDVEVKMDGLFIEIGLSANTSVVEGVVERNKIGEIIIDENNMTSEKGIFAAGDCTTVKHKQIVIAVGEGAKAALSAFNYLLSEY